MTVLAYASSRSTKEIYIKIGWDFRERKRVQQKEKHQQQALCNGLIPEKYNEHTKGLD